MDASTDRIGATVPEHLRISRDELLAWVDSGAGYDLPGLVRRLVIETTPDLERVHFPAGVGATSGGWDGRVRASSRNAFVPAGHSVWELSVEKASQPKAEDDFAKRLVEATSDVTYVQLICRPWTKAAEFAATHNADRRWKEVLAYNVDDLETWLETAPMTTIWLAEKIGRPVDGIRSADAWWADWLASTTVPLNEDIILAGRSAEAEVLRARVGEPGTTVVGGELRPEELRAFVAAVFGGSQLEGTRRPVLFLTDTDDARRLVSRPGNLLVVAPNMAFVQELPVANHHVIVLSSGKTHADITVPPVSSAEVEAALKAAGVADGTAHDHGTLGRRSRLALRRRLAIKPSLHEPKWAAAGADAIRRRMLLASSWNQSVPGDREALEALTGRTYAEIEDCARAAMAEPDDPMVSLTSDLWHVVSLADAWMLLGAQISSTDIEAFRQHAKNVLLEPDPFAGLTEVERLHAQFNGVRRRYSENLASGVAKSLALLGTVDDAVEVGAGRTGASIASSIVWELLDAANRDLTGATWKERENQTGRR